MGVEVSSEDGLVVVELEDIGEGVSGEYTGEAGDVPLLRFTVLREEKDGGEPCADEGVELVAVDDASYCTQIPVSTSRSEQARLARLILAEVEAPVRAGKSVKKLCERLSWINPTWGTKRETKGWVLGS